MNQTKVHVINNAFDGKLPKYETSQAAGMDVRANLESDLVLAPGESALIKTGLKVAIPEGFEIQVRPRSGLAYKNQVTVLNSPGTIDACYRGDIGVILINHGKKDFTVEPGMRIAQIVLARFEKIDFVITDSLEDTDRGEGGFGSTGTS